MQDIAIELATQEDTLLGDIGSSIQRADGILSRNVLSKMGHIASLTDQEYPM